MRALTFFVFKDTERTQSPSPIRSTYNDQKLHWTINMPDLLTHKGSCHCGKVQFEIDAPADLHAHACNCSMCYRSGGDQMIVPASRFRLIAGADAITTYTFNTGAAKHTFCKYCGIKAFYTPRSNPDGFSANLRCLDRTHIKSVVVEPFDGQNWELHAGALAHLSRDE